MPDLDPDSRGNGGSEPGSAAFPDPAIERLLTRVTAGERLAATELLPLVYDHLRAIARAKLEREPAGQTLQPTALVHEAYMKIVRGDRSWNDRRHFFAAAALAMRQILVDRARAKRGEKRGGGGRRVSLEFAEDTPGATGASSRGVSPQDEGDVDWIAFEDAMSSLEAQDPGLAEIVHLRYFAGLTVEETAMAIGVSARTINRDWLVARAWLLRRMREGGPSLGNQK